MAILFRYLVELSSQKTTIRENQRILQHVLTKFEQITLLTYVKKHLQFLFMVYL